MGRAMDTGERQGRRQHYSEPYLGIHGSSSCWQKQGGTDCPRDSTSERETETSVFFTLTCSSLLWEKHLLVVGEGGGTGARQANAATQKVIGHRLQLDEQSCTRFYLLAASRAAAGVEARLMTQQK